MSCIGEGKISSTCRSTSLSVNLNNIANCFCRSIFRMIHFLPCIQRSPALYPKQCLTSSLPFPVKGYLPFLSGLPQCRSGWLPEGPALHPLRDLLRYLQRGSEFSPTEGEVVVEATVYTAALLKASWCFARLVLHFGSSAALQKHTRISSNTKLKENT